MQFKKRNLIETLERESFSVSEKSNLLCGQYTSQTVLGSETNGLSVRAQKKQGGKTRSTISSWLDLMGDFGEKLFDPPVTSRIKGSWVRSFQSENQKEGKLGHSRHRANEE